MGGNLSHGDANGLTLSLYYFEGGHSVLARLRLDCLEGVFFRRRVGKGIDGIYRVFIWNLDVVKRKRGRPRNKWCRDLEADDFKKLDIAGDKWRDCPRTGMPA